ncbi:MAG TPA: putative Ig domain-containing protein, partial [Pseudomonadales bacterium]|nr:putative Ig domain-containing protein [Pseudomonadales bacterium]
RKNIPLRAADPENSSLFYRLTNAPFDFHYNEVAGEIQGTATALGNYQMQLSVSDAAGNTVTDSITLSVVAPLASTTTPPVIDSTVQSKTILIDEPYSYQATAFDPNKYTINFSLDQSPPEMAITADGLISWKPGANDIGEHTVQLRVSNQYGAWATQTWVLSVRAPEQPSLPITIVSSPPTNAWLAQEYHYQLVVQQSTNSALNYTLLDGSDPGMRVDPTTGLFTWTPTYTGLSQAVVRVEDEHGSTSTQTWKIKVLEGQQSFYFTSDPNYFALIKAQYEYGPALSTHGSGQVVFSLGEHPSGASIDAQTGVVHWTPSQYGTYPIEIRATDPTAGTTSQTFSIHVVDNVPFVFTTQPLTDAFVNTPYFYAAKASKYGSGQVNYTLLSGPSGMQMDATGAITWTPTSTGNFSVTISATSGRDTATQNFTLTVYSAQIHGRKVCN